MALSWCFELPELSKYEKIKPGFMGAAVVYLNDHADGVSLVVTN